MRQDRTEGARGVNSRGTTLLARSADRLAASISRLFRSWEPPTWAYLPRGATFFGQPLWGAFQKPLLIPGLHHLRVAGEADLCTSPRRRGGPSVLDGRNLLIRLIGKER